MVLPRRPIFWATMREVEDVDNPIAVDIHRLAGVYRFP